MEINEQETRNYNRTITFVLQNVFSQNITNPFNIIGNLSDKYRTRINRIYFATIFTK